MGSRKKAHAVRRNGRLGIEVPMAPLLPPIRPSLTLHAPLAQQQEQELNALRDAFCERLRVNAKLDDLALLLDRSDRHDVASADTATTPSSHTPSDQHTVERNSSESDDCFMSLQRTAALLAPAHPFAAQFVSSLVDQIHALVRERLRTEAAITSARSLPASIASPRTQPQRNAVVGVVDSTATTDAISAADVEQETTHVHGTSSSDNDTGDSDEGASDDDVAASQDGSTANDVPRRLGAANDVPRRLGAAMSPRGNTFRHSLRCRAFPPTRVPASEFIATPSAYTPLDHSRTAADLASIHLEADAASRWRIVMFPKPKPSVSRNETAALIQWATRRFALLASQAPHAPATYAQECAHFERSLALIELVGYELARLVFDRCPTTARFVHGLVVELVDTALRTVAHADRDMQLHAQRLRNVEREHERLAEQLSSMRAAIASLEETLRARQRQLLSERERIIWQRKRLNVLLCTDQVLIRSVAALVQHLLDLADELLSALAVDDPHGLLDSQLARVLYADPCSGGDNSDATAAAGQRVVLVDELYELVTTKYAGLCDVRNAIARVEKARADREEIEAEAAAHAATATDSRTKPTATTRSSRVVVLDVDKVATAAEDFRGALRRLERLVSTKSPDSAVGWAPQELWDQALFLPPPEDIQDLDRDVQRLCRYVETHVLQQRRRNAALCRCHAAVQTNINACVRAQPRTCANGFVSYPTAFAFDPAPNGNGTGALDCTSISSIVEPNDDAAAQHRRAEHRELLEQFLPSGLRRFMRTVPHDYAPRQLSLSAVHAIISYLYNEMWLLVRDACVAQPPPTRFAATATARHTIPVADVHAYVYRIYVAHFRDPAFGTSRLLDLLVSASRLDTQSCKVQLFCRLLHVPGCAPLDRDAFWFALKTMHVLQRACSSAGHYYLLDASGANEFIPHASATEALALLFRGAANDAMKRLRLRLAGLASVYGAIWIPASSIMELAIDEWTAAQDALRMNIHEQIAAEHDRATAVATATASDDSHSGPIRNVSVPSLASFIAVFAALHLKVHRLEAAQTYRQLLLSAKQTRTHGGNDVTAVSAERFRHLWADVMLHAVNQAQQQQYVPSATQQHHSSSNDGESATTGVQGIHFGPPADAFVAANRRLSSCFLRVTWQQTKNDFIRGLDAAFHDIGLQVRLVQQMDAVVTQDDDDGATAVQGWRSLQQLIQITTAGKVDAT